MEIGNLSLSSYLSALNNAPQAEEVQKQDDSHHHNKAAHASNFLHNVSEWFNKAFSNPGHSGSADL